MHKTHAGCIRGFYWRSMSWYANHLSGTDPAVDEITIGMYHPGNGTTGEFSVRFVPMSGGIRPMLVVFDDAWSALQQFQDLLAKMAEHDDRRITPEALAQILIDCGVKDLTERTNPRNRTASPGAPT